MYLIKIKPALELSACYSQDLTKLWIYKYLIYESPKDIMSRGNKLEAWILCGLPLKDAALNFSYYCKKKKKKKNPMQII